MEKMKREKTVCFIMWIYSGIGGMMAVVNAWFLWAALTVAPVRGQYKPGFAFEHLWHFSPVPKTWGLAYEMQDYLHYYFSFLVLFVLFFLWFYELDDEDEFHIQQSEKLPRILFDRALKKVAKIHLIVPFFTALVCANLYPDGILPLNKGIILSSVTQICCFILYAICFSQTWKKYKTERRDS